MDLLKEIERLRADMMANPMASHRRVRADVLVELMRTAESYLQPDLFAVPHQKKSATSAEAAEKWRPKARSNGLYALNCVFRHPGVTRELLCIHTGMLNQTASGRLNVLKSAGLIRADGKRKASTGFNQEVYYITQRGADFLKQIGAENGKEDAHETA